MKRVYIYSLIDENGYFRYIGISQNPKIRYNSHLTESRKTDKTHKNKWIRNMFKKGLKPTLYLIDVFDTPEEAKKEEIRLIEHFKNYVKLTNGTKGGDGTNGWIPSAETRKKIGDANRGRKWTKEQKLAISNIRKGRKHNFSLEAKEKLSNRMKTNNPAYKYLKPVFQFDKEGNFIKEWESGQKAGKELNIETSNINRCCNNKYRSAGGFIWKFKKEVKNVL